MAKKDEMEEQFEDASFAILESLRQGVEKNQKILEKVSTYMKISSSSLVVDILMPQAIAIIFMAGLIDDISPPDFVSYTESFTNTIKNNIFKIRKARLSNLNKES